MIEHEKREKVIKGLECCSGDYALCTTCYLENSGTCRDTLMKDAIELLKAQEPADSIPIDWLMNYAQLPTEFAISAWRKPKKEAEIKQAKSLDKSMSLDDALELLEAQEPRIMKVDEVTACEVDTVLWVEERQGVTWNLFPLEIDVSSTHPDTGITYLFFITYHDIRKFECDEYNQTWRCWTSRPTDAQRDATPWDIT